MLSGPLPSDLHQCSQLTVLNLSNNNFSGQIPKTFWKMKNLEMAYFSRNNLVGTIPKEINNLTNLHVLYLEDNHLTGTLPKEIHNLTNLRALILRYNHLTGIIPEELGNLRNLEDFVLENNEMTGTIPERIFNISSLIGLDLSANHFTGSLPSTTGFGLQNLILFSVSKNMLNGVMPLFIANSSRLSTIDLSVNNFRGVIPNFLGSLRYLKILNLYGNELTKDSSPLELDFLSPLANCSYLNYVLLSFNPFNGILPKSIGNLSNSITVFIIAGCGISGEIPSGMGNLSNLMQLDLSQNKFILPLPSNVALLQDLQYFNLGGNKLSGMISCDLFRLQHLSELYLDDNTFFGAIPECIGNATSLRKLNLGANELSSSIPSNLWNLNGLLKLNLSGNFLNGSLSNEVGNMKVTTLLDLSKNTLSGYIPDAIGSLQYLEELYLSYNLMEGMIPDSIGGMVSLVNLDLSNNNLTGSIPVMLAKLEYLNEFKVSHNNLVGLIPSGGSFKNFTWESFIFNKGLCGDKKFHVPPCLLTVPKRLWTRGHLIILCLGLIAIVVVITLVALYLIFRGKHMLQRSEELMQVTAMKRFSFYELQKATDGYDERNLLGKGSFGSVYKGTLSDGRVVAIKVFDIKEERSDKSFDVECEMLCNLHHRNLTKLISSCSNLEFKTIILEFMPNGSLENWLHSENHFLSLTERYNIIIDVAYALQYLHSSYPTPIVHADLKPSNVLLDEDKVAHVSDFGVAKMLEENSITYTNTIATFGYIAPEYGSYGLVSTKCDVFSFGILLMEVFTRKSPSDEMFNESLTLRGWINNSMNSAMIDIIDVNLLRRTEEKHINEMMDYVMMIMNVALNCTKELPKERSGMEEIIATLNKIKLKLL